MNIDVQELKLVLGDQLLQLIVLSSQLKAAQAQIAEMQDKKETDTPAP